MGQVQCVCSLSQSLKGRAGWAAFSINLRPLSAAIGVSCKESWSRVELGPHFILVTGVSAPQDQTSCSLASQRRHLSFKLSHFLRRLLLFYDNPSCSSTSLLGTGRFLSHSFSPLGWRLPATRASKRTYSALTLLRLKEPQILTGLYTFVSGYVYGCA